uniref:Uncharacterized protein n=1 Tax=Escherichia coli TaxID=562 RepID=A0A7U1HRV1_ECOLX|nr:hypothetical protein [Escherichia coli]
MEAPAGFEATVQGLSLLRMENISAIKYALHPKAREWV